MKTRSYIGKNRNDKFRASEDKDVLRVRLNELIRWMRWAVYLLAGIAVMIALFFIQRAAEVIISLF